MGYCKVKNQYQNIIEFLNDDVSSVDEAIEGAGHIIAERISDRAEYRQKVRELSFQTGEICAKAKKGFEAFNDRPA